MIQIIAGTFGYYNGRKIVPVTPESGPQKFDPELEARLVKEGVAEYVSGEEAKTPEDPDTTPAPDDTNPANASADPSDPPDDKDPDDDDEALPAYSEDMKLDELKEIAPAYGVDASAMRKKADIIAAIEAAKEAAGDDEVPPQFDAADPV